MGVNKNEVRKVTISSIRPIFVHHVDLTDPVDIDCAMYNVLFD